jgi:two-component system, chemotaxis family, chemotaxis protein CheY
MPEEASSSRLRALVVEDSAAMRSFVTAALEQGGPYDVTTAQSGFEALRELPRAHFDLIITDINMPDINGLELVRFVRDSERHKATPLVLISTDNRATDRDRGMKLGADAYVVKPFEPQELMAVVERVMKK